MITTLHTRRLNRIMTNGLSKDMMMSTYRRLIMYNEELIREAVDIATGDDGRTSTEVIEILRILQTGDVRMNIFEILVLSILAYFVIGSIVGFIYFEI